MHKLKEGFCFSVRLLDKDSTKLFVNVCGHPDCGLPQTKSGQDILPELLDKQGIDNLAIPIDVSQVIREPSERDPKVDVAFVDVVVSDAITNRCYPDHHFYQHFTERLTALALHWVKQETGLMLDMKTVKLLQNVKRKLGNKTKASESVARKANEMYEEMLRKQEEKDKEAAQEAAKLPDHFNLRAKPQAGAASGVSTGEPQKGGSTDATPSAAPAKKKPMVVELDGAGNEVKSKETAVKRGFLNQPNIKPLYPEGGTPEGNLPDGAGDPLGYLPKSLRSKVKTIDCTGADGAAKMMQTMEAHADGVGRGKSAAQPAVSTENQPAKGEEKKPVANSGEVDGGDDDFVSAWKRKPAADAAAADRDTRKKQEFNPFGIDDSEPSQSPAPPKPAKSPSSSPTVEAAPAPKSAAAVTSPVHVTNGISISEVTGDSIPSPSEWQHTVSEQQDTGVVIEIQVPHAIDNMRELDVDIDERSIRVSALFAEDGHKPLVIPLKRSIDTDATTAKFIKKLKTLKIIAVYM